MSAPGFAARVVRWQRVHGRHDLPWQNTRNPYRIWLSEIMLQQTQVATVIAYYQRFLARFPDLRSLAAATQDEVLAVWSGLGYYSRGRNLHRAAQRIVAEHGGRFPADYVAVLELPGIGRSTAAAICVFAFGARHAILDGNVKRLLARQFGITGYPGDAKVEAKLWQAAIAELPLRNVEAYTQGLMDLGNAVCVRGAPRCDACPVALACVARRRGTTGEIPAPRPRKKLPQRYTRMLVLLHAGTVLLEKRPPTGIWGGLWSLPEAGQDANLAQLCAQRYGVKISKHAALAPIAHSFTHFRLEIEPQRIAVASLLPRAASPGAVWLPIAEALVAAIPTPVRKIIAALGSSGVR